MQLSAHREADGYLKGPNVVWPGGDYALPGSLVVYVPVLARVLHRVGIVVARTEDVVHVAWNDWVEDPTVEAGDLRRRFGTVSSKRTKKEMGR